MNKTLCLISGFILLSACGNHSIENQNLEYQPYRGIDLSHHNVVYDWSQVEVEVDFVILKATEGATYQDPKFKQYLEDAKSHNIYVGAYHFMTTSTSAEAQFENFKNVVHRGDIDLIPVLDIERFTKGHRISKQKLRQEVRIFCDLCINYYGSAPIIYCSEHFYRDHFTNGFEDCMYWCGDVNRAPTISCDLHQVTKKYVKGIKGKVDYNQGFRPLSDFIIPLQRK